MKLLVFLLIGCSVFNAFSVSILNLVPQGSQRRLQRQQSLIRVIAAAGCTLFAADFGKSFGALYRGPHACRRFKSFKMFRLLILCSGSSHNCVRRQTQDRALK